MPLSDSVTNFTGTCDGSMITVYDDDETEQE